MDFQEPQGRVLVIAGSDSGGGAGIQADIKAVTAMGGFAATAVTAITVQNTLGVSAIHPVPLDIIRGQIETVLSDIGADVVKIGMLGSVEVVDLVADCLAACDLPIPLVLDPVMIATSGDALVDDGTETAIRDRLLPMASLITPNIPEAEALTGLEIGDVTAQLEAANRLVEMGARAALVKGGHLKGEAVTDVLVSTRGMELMERPRLPGRNTHGTGCTLASAIAGLLADGAALPDAVRRAGDYLHEAIARAPGFGAGHGPVNHAWVMRS